jgi:hypothetical protein
MPRPTAFDLVFAPLGEQRFAAIRDALAAHGYDPADRDAFLMESEAVLLLRELRPEGGVGEGMDQLAALVHHAFLFWLRGSVTVPVGDEQLQELLGDALHLNGDAGEAPRAFYAQFPERRVWAAVIAGQAPEPLDGCFVHGTPAGELRVLGVFGLHPDRGGFSVVEAVGPRPVALERPDGSPLFSPTLAGGAAARLYSITGGEELLELGWRAGAGAVQWTP